MPNSVETGYLEWFKKAEEDAFAGEKILEAKKFFAPACFHFQQMAEKYLKGLLVFCDKSFPKVHDLIYLETLLLEQIPEVNILHADLKLLNRYYIETRYPGDYPKINFIECQKAFDSAKRIRDFVMRNIKRKHRKTIF